MKLAILLLCTVLIANPAYAQLTTWTEDMNQGKAFEAQHDFRQAEESYRHALANFRDIRDPNQIRSFNETPHYKFMFQDRKSTQTCNCDHGDKCAESLKALLVVLYAENKLSSATDVCKALLIYLERTAGADNPAVIQAKANYKKLLERVETEQRWSTIAPKFKQYRMVGMDRTRVHEILGPPNAAYPGDSQYSNDYPKDALASKNHRDFYVLSNTIADAPQIFYSKFGTTQYPGQVARPFSFLDIDYADDSVVRYRLRSRDQIGAWVSNNAEPRLPKF